MVFGRNEEKGKEEDAAKAEPRNTEVYISKEVRSRIREKCPGCNSAFKNLF